MNAKYTNEDVTIEAARIAEENQGPHRRRKWGYGTIAGLALLATSFNIMSGVVGGMADISLELSEKRQQAENRKEGLRPLKYETAAQPVKTWDTEDLADALVQTAANVIPPFFLISFGLAAYRSKRDEDFHKENSRAVQESATRNCAKGIAPHMIAKNNAAGYSLNLDA